MAVFEKTPLPNLIWKAMANNGFNWNEPWSISVLQALLEGMAEYLSEVKNETPQVVVVQDDNKKNKFGAMVEKMDNEESDGFTLSYFFITNDDDIPADANVISIDNPVPIKFIEDAAFRSYHMRFASTNGVTYLPKLINVILDCIYEYMIANVKLDKTLVFTNYITIDSELVGDKVVLKVTPDEKLKQHIKDDVNVSVA